MPSTHAAGVLVASTSCAVGAAANTVTSTTLDNATGYGATITAKVTNGATGPTVGCTATVNISPDGSTWYFYASQTAGTILSTAYPMLFEVTTNALKIQITFGQNTGQAVTVEAQYEQTTGL
jgi:uncharacterized membrane protein